MASNGTHHATTAARFRLDTLRDESSQHAATMYHDATMTTQSYATIGTDIMTHIRRLTLSDEEKAALAAGSSSAAACHPLANMTFDQKRDHYLYHSARAKRLGAKAWWFLLASSSLSTLLTLLVICSAAVNTYYVWSGGSPVSHPYVAIAGLWIFGIVGLAAGICTLIGLSVTAQAACSSELCAYHNPTQYDAYARSYARAC